VVAFSAVGSLKGKVKPRDFVIPDQVIDRTKGVRPWTFFEKGFVGHIGFADPFDNLLRDIIIKTINQEGLLQGEGIMVHGKGTVICMEGPQFSTRAESQLYCSWNASCINMSVLPEAKLAREAELGYAMICMSTDYDSWHSTNETVSVEMVMGHMRANVENAKRIVQLLLDTLGSEDEEKQLVVLGEQWKGNSKWAAMTKEEGRKKETVESLAWLFPGYFSGN